MKHLVKLFILIGLFVNIVRSYGANQALGDESLSGYPSAHGQSAAAMSWYVWGLVSQYCDAPTMTRLAQVNSKVGYEPSRQLIELREWKNNGGLLIALFGIPQDQDVENLRKMLQWGKKGVSSFTFDDYKRLLTGFVQVLLDQEAVAALSSNMQNTIQRDSNLTSSQKEFLGLLLPDKTPDEISENLGRRILNGACECVAQFLEDRNEQYRKCMCWVKLSDSDLRRITPRILAVANQLKGSDVLIGLFLAHIENKYSSISWPMKHPNSKLRAALILKLKEELAAQKYTGSGAFEIMGLYMCLGCWGDVDKLSILALEQSKSFSDYVLKKGVLSFQSNVTIPIIRQGRVICWLLLKLGLVKR